MDQPPSTNSPAVRHSENRIRIVFYASVVLVGVMFSACAYDAYDRFGRSSDLVRLLAGEEGIEIQSVVIEGQSELITLDDPVALKYLMDALRGASHGKRTERFGSSYSASIDFGRRYTELAHIDAPDGMDGVNVAPLTSFVNDDPDYRWVPFRKPIPPELEKTLAQMREPGRRKRQRTQR